MSQNGHIQTGTAKIKRGLAEMLKGGVIMDVVTPEHATIAQEAGAAAVMALERVPADIRVQGGVARMSDPKLIKSIMASVSIPVMAKCRIGHFVEAQILDHVTALLLTAGDSDRAAALELGDLADDAPDRPGGAGDDDRFALLGAADVQQPEIGSQTRHAECAQVDRQRR